MTWANEAEIDTWQERYAGHPVLGPASQYLSDYRDLINGCSDGWPYWTRGTRCAGDLTELVQHADYDAQGLQRLLPAGYQPPTAADVRRAARKIELFVRREPQLQGQAPPVLEER